MSKIAKVIILAITDDGTTDLYESDGNEFFVPFLNTAIENKRRPAETIALWVELFCKYIDTCQKQEDRRHLHPAPPITTDPTTYKYKSDADPPCYT